MRTRALSGLLFLLGGCCVPMKVMPPTDAADGGGNDSAATDAGTDASPATDGASDAAVCPWPPTDCSWTTTPDPNPSGPPCSSADDCPPEMPFCCYNIFNYAPECTTSTLNTSCTSPGYDICYPVACAWNPYLSAACAPLQPCPADRPYCCWSNGSLETQVWTCEPYPCG
jgi:hypothetical protein